MKAGKITVITGPMFASKTETLVSYLNKEKYRQRHVVCYKPTKDDRYSTENVVSHNGNAFPSGTAQDSAALLKLIRRFRKETSKLSPISIGIDEIQFFDNNVAEVCWDLSLEGYRIFVAGLDLDSFGKPFGPMPGLLTYADKVIKLNAQCKVCGENARMTLRNSTSPSDTVLVGGAGTYEPRCKFHWKS